MKLWFEVKKLLLSPIYWFLLLCVVGLTYYHLEQGQAYQLLYQSSSINGLTQLQERFSNLKFEEESQDRMLHERIQSDLALITTYVEEKNWTAIPKRKILLYEDLQSLMTSPSAQDQVEGILDQQEVARTIQWNRWLVDHSLPDIPQEKGWSTARFFQAIFETVFSFAGLGVIGAFCLIFQVEERQFGYTKWKCLQNESLFRIEKRRLFAKTLALSFIGLSSLVVTIGHGILHSYLSIKSFMEPMELFNQTWLIPIWLYLLFLLLMGLVFVITIGMLLSLLDFVIQKKSLFVSTSLFLVLFIAYQASLANDWLAKLIPLIPMPTFLRQSMQPVVFIQIGLCFVFVLGLYLLTRWLMINRRPRLSNSQHRTLPSPKLRSQWSFECLQLSRNSIGLSILSFVVIFSLVFSIFLGIEKRQVLRQEADMIKLNWELSKELLGETTALDDSSVVSEEAEVLHSSLTTDSLQYQQEDLKKNFENIYLAFPQDQEKLISLYLEKLGFEKDDLNSEQSIFDSGNVGGSQTVSNLHRLMTRNAMSSFYWQELQKNNGGVNKRGYYVVLPEVETLFKISDDKMKEELSSALDWDRSTDLSGLGSLRSLLDGYYYLILLLVALWIGSRGKAIEAQAKTWLLYQTQPISRSKVLIHKWLLSIIMALGLTLGMLLAIFSFNVLLNGLGNWSDGVLMLSKNGQGMHLEHLVDPLSVWFMPNTHYITSMVGIILLVQVVLVTLSHLIQVVIPNRLLSYLAVLALAMLGSYLVTGELVVEGLSFFRQLFL